jgi:hypothetical protein
LGCTSEIQETIPFPPGEHLSRLFRRLFLEKLKTVWPGGNPPCPVQGQAAAGGEAMNVRMVLQVLAPGVQHRDGADLGTEMPSEGREPARHRQPAGNRRHAGKRSRQQSRPDVYDLRVLH